MLETVLSHLKLNDGVWISDLNISIEFQDFISSLSHQIILWTRKTVVVVGIPFIKIIFSLKRALTE